MPTYWARGTTERRAVGAAGVLVFTWDDGYPEWDQMIALATQLGQRHTLCVTSDRIGSGTGISSASIVSAFAGGHEIAAHSKTHTKINSSLAAATRLTEYETPRTVLEGLIGAGNVRTWAYPFGTASSPAGRDATTDQEIYLRYDRQLDTVGGMGGIMPLNGPPRFTIPRINWSPYGAGDNTEQIKELVRRAASSPIIVPIYAHDFATSPGWTNVQAVMQLANDLNVPCVTVSDAFPASPFTLPDPGFEGSSVTWMKAPDTVGTYAHATVTPDVNMPGTKSLAITASDFSHAPQAYMDWQIGGGVSITVSGRVRSDIIQAGTSPAMKVYVRCDYYKYDGSSAGSGVDSAGFNLTTWQRLLHTVTTPAGTELVRIKLVQQACQGTTYFDHLHFGPTDYGSFG